MPNDSPTVEVMLLAQQAAGDRNWTFLLNHLQRLTSGRSLTALEAKTAFSLAVEALIAGDFQLRWDLVKVFAKLNPTDLKPLLDLLADEDAEEELRWFVLRILERFHQPPVLLALVEVLQTAESDDLRSAAAQALADRGTEAIAACTELLDDPASRPFAVQALACLNGAEVVEPLLSVVTDDRPEVRATAIAALSQFNHPRIEPALMQALGDRASQVRREAVEALGLVALRQAQQQQPKSTEFLEALRPLLRDVVLEVSQQGAIALGRVGTPEAAGVLFAELTRPHVPAPLQVQLVRALSWMELPAAIAHLQQSIELLGMEHPITPEIIAGLGRVQAADLKSQAADAICNFIARILQRSPSTHLLQVASFSLGQLGQPQGIPALIPFLRSPEATVRLHAIAALKQLDANFSDPESYQHGGDRHDRAIPKIG